MKLPKTKYDVLIVGAGFFGASFARVAADLGKKCLVIDKNSHVAGAAHDEKMDNIIVSKAGAHILHSHDDKIWEFLNQFATIEPFINKPKVLSENKVYSFPINMMTLHQLWGVVTPKEAREKLNKVRIPCKNPKNFEEWALSMIGEELYTKFVYNYTKKQYMKEPKELPSSIIQRLPIRLTYEENYFTTKYQGMPKEGFTKMVENMLSGIDIELGVDFFNLSDWKKYAKQLIYTGPIDKFFNYEFGKLEYHTLRFEYEKHYGDYQGNAVFNHVDANTPYIRSIEHKHFRSSQPKHYNPKAQNNEPTIVSYDYPVPFKEHPEPYYPLRDKQNSDLYSKYFNLKKNYPNILFGGRLGEFKYYDLDQSASSAISKAKKLFTD